MRNVDYLPYLIECGPYLPMCGVKWTFVGLNGLSSFREKLYNIWHTKCTRLIFIRIYNDWRDFMAKYYNLSNLWGSKVRWSILHDSPLSIFNALPLRAISADYRIKLPKFSLDISKNNFVIIASTLWNEYILDIFDKPVLTEISCTSSSQLPLSYIIPGSTKNSDTTMTVATFKYRMKQCLLKSQKSGDTNEW